MLRLARYRERARLAPLIGSLFVAAGCVAPATQLAAVSPERLADERLFQQQYVISGKLAEQERVDRVAYPIMKAAVGLCKSGLAPLVGVRYATAHDFGKEYVGAARSLGFSDTLTVTSVLPGGPGDRAGVRPGDRLVVVNTSAAPIGRNAIQRIGRMAAAPSRAPRSRRRKDAPAPALTAADSVLTLGLRTGPDPMIGLPSLIGRAPDDSSGDSVVLTVSREEMDGDGQPRDVTVQPEWVCGGRAVAVKSNALNAWTDGKLISVTSGMLRFAVSDEELGLVVAHEVAHNIMGHIDAKRANAAMGTIFGALIDIAAATQGVNTNGDFTRIGGELGAMVFSQEFELEADLVGLYLLARAGIPANGALQFWRRMAVEDPDMIQFAASHPTAPRRFVALEAGLAEIEAKRQAGQPLEPNLRTNAPAKSKRKRWQ